MIDAFIFSSQLHKNIQKYNCQRSRTTPFISLIYHTLDILLDFVHCHHSTATASFVVSNFHDRKSQNFVVKQFTKDP